MDDDPIRAQLVAAFLRAHDTAQLVILPAELRAALDLERAYQVGRVLHEHLVARGFKPVGRKIGFTNPALWEQFKVSQPIWAHVYAQTVHFAQGGRIRLNLDGMTAPKLEPEVVLKLSKPIPSGAASVEDIARCVEWAAVGFEIVDSHYLDWRFTAAEAVADFGVHAGLVVGTPWHVDVENPQHVAALLPALKFTLRGGKDFSAEGEGRNALGSPLLALGSLARVLAGQPWAPPLAAGEIITTGTLTALPFLRRGETYHLEVTGAPLAALQLELE